MDTINQLVLAGAAEETVLEALSEQPSGDVGERAERKYVSCVRVKGRPILPPVMTEELRKECAEWRKKAMEKEQALLKKKQQTAATDGQLPGEVELGEPPPSSATGSESEGTMDSAVTSSLDPDDRRSLDLSDMRLYKRMEDHEDSDEEEEEEKNDEENSVSLEPKSFREIYEEVKNQQHLPGQPIGRQMLEPALSTGHQYNAALYLDREEDEGMRPEAGLYDSMQSLNTVIEVGGCGEAGTGGHPTPEMSEEEETSYIYGDVSSSISDSLPRSGREAVNTADKETTLIQPSQSSLPRWDAGAEKENAGILKERKLTARNEERRGRHVLADRDLNSSRENSCSSVTEAECGSRQDEQLEVLEVNSQEFRVRRGSYTLERPSPLLQAHLDRYGSDEEEVMSRHDMSMCKRTTYTSPGLGKFLSSREAAQRPITAAEQEAVLQRYLGSLAEKPVKLSLTDISASTTTADAKQSHRPVNGTEKVSPGTSYPGKPVVVARNLEQEIWKAAEQQQPLQADVRIRGSRMPSIEPDDGTASTASSVKWAHDSSTAATPSRTEQSIAEKTAGPLGEDLNSIVSELALSHKRMLEDLLARQEEERRRLRQEFEERQQQLISQILAKFPRLSVEGLAASSSSCGDGAQPDLPRPSLSQRPDLNTQLNRPTPVSLFPDASPASPSVWPGQAARPAPGRPLAPPGTSSSSVPSATTPSSRRELSSSFDRACLTSPSVRLSPDSPFPQRRSGLDSKPGLCIPEEVFEPRYRHAWVKLSAIAKGFLTRKLFSTEKVQMLKKTIRETLACAIQLHLEMKGPPSRQDLELHGRLLAQLESACQAVHQIFFRLGIPERMAIIALDRAAAKAKEERSDAGRPTRRISAATAARLENKAKAKATPLSAGRWSPKRPKMSRSQSQEQRAPSPPLKQAFQPRETSRSRAFNKTGQTRQNKPAWK